MAREVKGDALPNSLHHINSCQRRVKCLDEVCDRCVTQRSVLVQYKVGRSDPRRVPGR